MEGLFMSIRDASYKKEGALGNRYETHFNNNNKENVMSFC